jgi:hypothetical protein
MTSTVATTNRQAEHDSKVLAQVKDALIAWSASRTPPDNSSYARPGELPCPDNDNSGTDPGGCTAGAIGRVPWKSLRIPEPRDSTGEVLWYAISGPFRYSTTSPITSDTQGDLVVYQDSTASTVTSNAIAVIFAPGAALGIQARGTTAEQLDAANYLDTLAGLNNALAGGPFVKASTSSNSFNDRVLHILNTDLMPVVEQRVAREMIGYLNSYRAAVGVYPWGDLGDGDSNGIEDTAAYNRNRFPCGTALPTDWDSGGSPRLPNWLKIGCGSVTGWAGMIYYAIARNRLQNSGSGCTTCSASSLTVTNSTSSYATQCSTAATPVCTTQVVTSGSADVVLLLPGAYTGSPARSWSISSWSTISGYFVDNNSTVSSENRDNNDDTYYVPSGTGNNRTRMYVVR